MNWATESNTGEFKSLASMKSAELPQYGIECKKCGYLIIITTEYEKIMRDASDSEPELSLKDVFINIEHRLICRKCGVKGSVNFVTNNATLTNRMAVDKNDDPQFDRKYCIDCGDLISQSRLNAVPGATRCVNCQSVLEKADPNLTSRRVDEGLVGSREGHKKMRARQWKGRRRP